MPLEELLCSGLPRDFPSRSSVTQALKKGCLLLDGEEMQASLHAATTRVERGQRVAFVVGPAGARPHRARAAGVPPQLELEWVFEDEWMAACVKPHGVAVQGDPSARLLKQAMGWALPPPAHRPDALSCPRHAHRIDKATGGLLLVARTRAAASSLATAFHDGEVQKTYLALVAGKLEGEGVVDAPLSGKAARSRWVALQHTASAASGFVTTVRLHPETGRTHQLRRHLAHLGTSAGHFDGCWLPEDRGRSPRRILRPCSSLAHLRQVLRSLATHGTSLPNRARELRPRMGRRRRTAKLTRTVAPTLPRSAGLRRPPPPLPLGRAPLMWSSSYTCGQTRSLLPTRAPARRCTSRRPSRRFSNRRGGGRPSPRASRPRSGMPPSRAPR